ncbi:MAG: 23S rRNA (adenine(2503)-C(2))-methyltransferase RlmN, partial [Planctomycetaceae bacterium]|nr:23S rRNA (adenine(2503)-C(2))-methyltransferase RlmN [Planctomycetaceae bacterium]
MTEAVSICDVAAVEALRRRLGLDPEVIRRLRNRLFKRFLPDSAALDGFPDPQQLVLHSLSLHQRFDSATDGATKLLFRTAAGMLMESVILRILTGRTTLCVSSQIGCAAACDFCATGRMGIAQNLTAAEILDQIVQAGQIAAAEGRRLNNIVFMGMGEPFHNEPVIHEVLHQLTDPKLFARSAAGILVSTVGIPDAMLRCVEAFPDVNLALSLHSVNPQVRRQIIPVAVKYPLEELRRTVLQINQLQQRTVMIEYLMLAGLNDSMSDADDLVKWLDGLRVHINLIPFNPVSDAPHLQGSSRDAIDRFADCVKSHGLKTTVRYSLGSDIDAACGQ